MAMPRGPGHRFDMTAVQAVDPSFFLGVPAALALRRLARVVVVAALPALAVVRLRLRLLRGILVVRGKAPTAGIRRARTFPPAA